MRIIRFFCLGETRANTLTGSTTLESASSDMWSSSLPNTILLGIQADMFADMAGNQFIIAGQDLDLYAVIFQRSQRLSRVRLRRGRRQT